MDILLTFAIAFAVLVVASEAKLYGKCKNDDECEGTGMYCAKYSNCDEGTCICKPYEYYKDGDTCKKVTKVVSENEKCSRTKPAEPCTKGTGCRMCVKPSESQELKCRKSGVQGFPMVPRKECKDDGDCSGSGSACSKLSGCETGGCVCKYPNYYLDGNSCKEVTRVLSKGQKCNPGNVKEPCEKDTTCAPCTQTGTEFECRGAGGSNVQLSMALLPIMYLMSKMF